MEKVNAIEFHGIVFDDYVKAYDEEGEYYSQICDDCAKKLIATKQINERMLDKYAAGGICCVQGCQHESDHYIDFYSDEPNSGVKEIYINE
jgi:hypothetical protein